MNSKPRVSVWRLVFLLLALPVMLCWLVACGGVPPTKLPVVAAWTPTSALEANAHATIIAARATIAAAETPMTAPSPSQLPTPQIATIAPPSPPPTIATRCGNKIAYMGIDSQLWIVDVKSAETMQVTTLSVSTLGAKGEQAWHPQWFPDGQRLVFTTHEDTLIINADGTGLRRLGYASEDPAVSPDGAEIAAIIGGSKRLPSGVTTFATSNLDVYEINSGSHRNLTGCTDERACILSHPTWSPDGQWIAFSGSNVFDVPDWKLWVVRSDGSERRQLDVPGQPISWAAWSPDGTRIAYEGRPSPGSSDWALYVMRADGSGSYQLNLLGWLPGSGPTWSPDGQMIGVETMQIGRHIIFMLNVDGSDSRALVEGSYPAWQPCTTRSAAAVVQGTFTPAPTSTLAPSPSPTLRPTTQPVPRITFVGPDYNIWVMNSDGSDRRPLISGIRAVGGMTWSPDCSQIAFTRDCTVTGGSTCSHIVIADADGSDPIEPGLSPLEQFPRWSPDGRWIAYTEVNRLYLMSPDGKSRRYVTQGSMPAWSPDSTRLVYSNFIEGRSSGIFVAALEGSNPIQLTRGYSQGNITFGDLDPDWSPDGQKILFSSGLGIYVVDSDGRSRVQLTPTGDDTRWSPDGTLIVFARMGGDMALTSNE